MVEVTYHAEVTREGDQYLATVRELRGVHTFADSLDELMDNVVEAIVAMTDEDPDNVELLETVRDRDKVRVGDRVFHGGLGYKNQTVTRYDEDGDIYFPFGSYSNFMFAERPLAKLYETPYEKGLREGVHPEYLAQLSQFLPEAPGA